MASAYWVSKCKWCGKVDDVKRCTTAGPYPPVKDPDPPMFVSPTCPESPTKRHKFEWTRYR